MHLARVQQSNAMGDRMEAALDKLKANRGAVAGAVGLGVAAAAFYYVIRRRGRSIVPKGGPFTAETLQRAPMMQS